MNILPTNDGARKKVLKITVCSQRASRCVSGSKICYTNFSSHEWIFHLNIAGGDNVCLVIQTRQRQDCNCMDGRKGAVKHFFMEWHAENDPNPRNVSLK